MDARLRMAGGDLLQRALEPGVRLHAIELASCDQRSDPAPSMRALVVAGEQRDLGLPFILPMSGSF